MKTGELVATATEDGKTVRRLDLAPQETVLYFSPRGEILDAPGRWFELQRNWWRGGREQGGDANKTAAQESILAGANKNPSVKPVTRTVISPKPLKERWTVDLSEGWKLLFVPDTGADGLPLDFGKADTAILAKEDTAWTEQGFDDSAWSDGKIDVWVVPEEQKTRRCRMRRTFTVPAEWKDGEIDLYVKSFFANITMGKLAVWLDGKQVLNPDNGSRGGLFRRVTAEVEPGKSYVLSLEVFGEGAVRVATCGCR